MKTAQTKTSDVIDRGSKSFAASARLFPADKRESVHRLYAWCRYCDDEIDGETLGFGTQPFDQRRASWRLVDLRAATNEAIAGRAREAPFIALQAVLARHDIPAQYPLDLIMGMAMDAEGDAFDTIDDVLRYSYHVAGTVGVMMAIILDVRDRPTLQRASDLGIAFQLTNIARDVISDSQRGRVYLPTAWLRECNLSPVDVSRIETRQRVFEVAARLLKVSDAYYRSSMVGIHRLPLRSAWAITSALRIYRRIGEQLLYRGPGAWTDRIATGKVTKLGMIGMAATEVLSRRLRHCQALATDRDGLWTPSALDVRSHMASAE